MIHNYRWRLGLAEGETKYDELEKRLAEARRLRFRRSRSKAMPTVLCIRGPPPMPRNSPQIYTPHGTGGIGHNLPQEAPQAFAQAVIDVDNF